MDSENDPAEEPPEGVSSKSVSSDEDQVPAILVFPGAAEGTATDAYIPSYLKELKVSVPEVCDSRQSEEMHSNVVEGAATGAYTASDSKELNTSVPTMCASGQSEVIHSSVVEGAATGAYSTSDLKDLNVSVPEVCASRQSEEIHSNIVEGAATGAYTASDSKELNTSVPTMCASGQSEVIHSSVVEGAATGAYSTSDLKDLNVSVPEVCASRQSEEMHSNIVEGAATGAYTASDSKELNTSVPTMCASGQSEVIHSSVVEGAATGAYSTSDLKDLNVSVPAVCASSQSEEMQSNIIEGAATGAYTASDLKELNNSVSTACSSGHSEVMHSNIGEGTATSAYVASDLKVCVPGPSGVMHSNIVEGIATDAYIASELKGLKVSISGEKGDDNKMPKETQCFIMQAGGSQQSFGGARPKQNKRQARASQELPNKESDDNKVPKDSQCFTMQEGSSQQSIGGAHIKHYKRQATTSEEIPSCPKKYYAVSFPTMDLISKDDPLIFEEKKDALQAICRHPDARFREFTSRTDAYLYATTPYPVPESSSLCEADRKLMGKAFSKDELFQLQKCIQHGNEIDFLELVWSNPRYLVSISDCPTLIQEERQYNALHVATISGRPGMVVTILSVLQDIQFISLLYPNEDSSTMETHIRCLVEKYLNMPDNVRYETPLHLACQLGHGLIVQILLSYSFCNTHLLNKLRKSAEDVICQYHDCSYDHKKKIHYLFKEMYYVPILQDEVQKFVGQPCDARTVLAAVTTHPVKEGSSATYCAFAGPAPLSKATKFYNILKGKKYILLQGQPKTSVVSSQKRMERDGRKLSKSLSIGWFEYWGSLDAWLDITSPNGLNYLSQHLNKLDAQINILSGEVCHFMDLVNNFVETFMLKLSEMASSNEKLNFFHQLQPLLSHLNFFYNYTFSNECELENIHEELGHLLYLMLTEDNHKNLDKFQVLKLFHLSQISNIGCFKKLQWKMLCCILSFAFYFQVRALFVVKPECKCSFATVQDLYNFSSKSCFSKLLSLRQEITNELVQKYEWELPGGMETSIMSLPSAIVTTDSQDDGSDLMTCTLKHCDISAEFLMYKNFFIHSATFCFVFRSIMWNSFRPSEALIDTFQEIMKCFNPLCNFRFHQDAHLAAVHHQVASCLFVQLCCFPREAVQWWLSSSKAMIERHHCIKSVPLEWSHFMCVVTLLNARLTGHHDSVCRCEYYIDSAPKSLCPVNCIKLLQRLQRLLKTSVRFNCHEIQVMCAEQEGNSEEEKYYTPPSSPLPSKSIYVRGEVLTDEDINISQALLESRVNINNYLPIVKWMGLLKTLRAPAFSKKP